MTPSQHEALTHALWQLRADRLLAASLGGSRESLDAIIAESDGRGSPRAHDKALGDASADLTYTPINPCRIVDTRNVGGPLAPNVTRNFVGSSANFSTQGGTATNCGMPNGVRAIAMNVYAVNPTSLGFIKVWASNATEPAVSTVNYQTGITAIATGAIVPVDGASNNGFSAESPAVVDFVADVVGYFRAPTNAYIQGGNAFGTTATLGTTDNQPLNVMVNGTRAMRFEPTGAIAPSTPNVIGGNAANTVLAGVSGATIGGGGVYSPTSGPHQVTGNYGTVSGGLANQAGVLASVGGGGHNVASGQYSTIPGGTDNVASALFSFAAGRRAKADTQGSFIWADSSDFDFGPSVPNFFGARATGGVGFTVAIDPGTGAVTQDCNYLPGTSGWACTSDRETKENFADVDTRAMLEKVVALPLTTWNFKGADPSLRMLGPTAQDFYAAFELGRNDKTIASGNLHGVALAAIQGLDAKVREQQAEIAKLREMVERLLAR
jgi:hypothetical protein